MDITVMSHKHHVIWSYRQLNCSFSSLIWLTTENTSQVPITGHLFVRDHQWLVDSPHKWPVMWKKLPCHDIIKVKSQALAPITLSSDTEYRQTSNICHTLVVNKLVGHSDVVGASPVSAAPTTSSLLIWTPSFNGLGKDNRQESFNFVVWCNLY